MKVTPFLLTEDDLELEATAVSDLPRQCRYSNRKLMPERSTRPMRRSVSAQSEPWKTIDEFAIRNSQLLSLVRPDVLAPVVPILVMIPMRRSKLATLDACALGSCPIVV